VKQHKLTNVGYVARRAVPLRQRRLLFSFSYQFSPADTDEVVVI